MRCWLSMMRHLGHRLHAGRRRARPPRIGAVLRTPVAVLAAVLAVLVAPGIAAAAPQLLVVDAHGRVHARTDRGLPPPDPAPSRVAATGPTARFAARSARAARSATTVGQALDALLAAGRLDPERHALFRGIYSRATRTYARLRGARRRELGAVLANVRALAAGRLLTPERSALAFLTLERNRSWWSARPLLSYGQRVSFSPSRLIWQFYPGQGLQVQWLGTFGKANGFWYAHDDEALRGLLDEAIALAVPRAGGLAWESLFAFDGGRPPWVSGLSQGTGIQALSRASVRLADPRYLGVAQGALGIFRTPAPTGVRLATPLGAHYLQYSFAPRLHILNGFVQALNGLADFVKLGGGADGPALLAAGLAQARAEVPTFDTGAWSLYARPGGESSLSYHVLLRDFLRSLCQRVPQPPVFCATAERFTTYLHTPPTLALRPMSARAGGPALLRFALSKVSTVTLTLLRSGRVVYTRRAQFVRGTGTFGFTPIKRGPLVVRLRAVDAAGNAAAVTGSIAVRRR
jgi:D-glucuronyl C5-epimerase C-terminus